MKRSNGSYQANLKRWQWRVLLSFGLLYFFYYAGRQNISLAIPLLREEYGWTEASLGLISASLFWSYAFGHLLWGRLADRFGGRILGTAGGLLSLFFNWICSFARTVGGLAFPWGMNGIAQSMGWSSGMSLVTHWWPREKRGLATGILLSTVGWASVAIWLIGGWIGEYWSWRGVFRIPSLFLGAASVVYFFTVKNYPHQVGFTDDAAEETRQLEETTGFKPYFNVLKNFKFDLACLGVGTAHLTRYFFLTWIPLYYFETLGLSIMKTAALSLYLPLGMAIGPLLSGWITDRFLAAKRYQAASGFLLAAAGATIAFGFTPPGKNVLGTILLLLVGFCVFAGEAPIWALCGDMVGKKQSGTGAGIMSWVAYMFAGLQGLLVGRVLTLYPGSWKLLFILVAIIQLVGVGALWAVKR